MDRGLRGGDYRTDGKTLKAEGMTMNKVHVREGRSEVLVYIDKHMTDRLSALEEAVRIIQREVIRERNNPDRNANWKPDDHIV